MRNVLVYLDAPTLGQPEVFMQVKEGLFDAAGDIGEGSRAFLQVWMDRYVASVKKHAGERALRLRSTQESIGDGAGSN